MNEERPIEKLLRRYAKKRREDAGAPEMHPATRRLLQGEVARQLRKPAADGAAPTSGQVWRGRLPWLSWAVVIVVVAGVAGMLLLGPAEKPFTQGTVMGSTSVQLAKNEPKPAESVTRLIADNDAPARKQLTGQPPPAPAPALDLPEPKVPAPTEAAAENNKNYAPAKKTEAAIANRDTAGEQKFKEELPRGRAVASAPSPAPAAPAGIAGRDQIAPSGVIDPALGGRIDRGGGDKIVQAEASQIRRSEVQNRTRASFDAAGAGGKAGAATPAQPVAPGKVDRNPVGGLPGFAGNYTNILPERYAYADVAKALPTPPVLTSFRVEQTGTQIRVIDADGSTYLGSVNSAPVSQVDEEVPEKDSNKLKLKQPPSDLAPRSAGVSSISGTSAQGYFYRVTGTNRTLNQPVEFSWNFVGAATNALGKMQTNLAVGGFGQGRTEGSSVDLKSSVQPGISGRAKLGTGKEIEIQAERMMPVNVETLKARRP